MTGEVETWVAEGTALIARPARYLVSVTGRTIEITTANRQVVQSAPLHGGEKPDEALHRLGYTRVVRPGSTQPMAWVSQPGGGQWTTAMATERRPVSGGPDRARR